MSGPNKPTDGPDFEATAAAVDGHIDEDEWQAPTLLQRVQRILHKYPALGPFIVLLVMLVAFGIIAPERFASARNISLIISQVTVVGTLAIGQTIIILTAGVDLSVGAIAVFASIVMANLVAQFGVPGIVALFIGFGFGTACGLFNGVLITKLRMPPFIVTLGTMSIFFALNLFVSGSATVRGRDITDPILDPLLANLNSVLGNKPDDVVTTVLLPGEAITLFDTRIVLGSIGMLIAYTIMWYVLKYTAWGRHIYAVGDDAESARLSGIRSDRLLLSVYGVAGLTYGLGAWFLLGRINAASPQALQLANLESITAVVIGGTSLFGGRGGVVGTLIGAIIVGTAINGLTIAGFDPLWQRFAVGVLIIVAVALDQWIRRVSD